MTERLYYVDANQRAFDARIVDMAGDGTRVYLDRSAFYPTSGGQANDLGTLDGVAVIDVTDEDERIAHVLAAPLPAAKGDTVRGEIDWARRHDHMQQHTGQHLLSAVLEDRLGLATVSVHFGADASTLDVAGAEGAALPLEPDALAAIETAANEIVAEARPVRVTFEDAAVATGLRKPSDRAGTLRIVTIEGLDRSACGGTHVATTALVGPIMLRRQEKVRQGLRIEFLCGRRALARARRDLDLLTRIARAWSASIDETATLVAAQADALRDRDAELARAAESLAGYRARELHAAQALGADGIRRIVERAIHGGADSARALGLAVSELPRAVLIAWSASPPSVLLATSPDSGLDAGRVLRPLLQAEGGRGGGSARLAQGAAPDESAVARVVAALAASPGALAQDTPAR